MLKRLFHDHPASVGETYTQHAGESFRFGAAMIAAGFACLVHGIFPFLFSRTGSSQVAKLHDRMVINRVSRDRTGKVEPREARRHG